MKLLLEFNLNFSKLPELIEVCLISLTTISWLLIQNNDYQKQLDRHLQANLPKLFIDSSQDLVVRHRTSLLCSFVLDTVFQSFPDDIKCYGLDLLISTLLDQVKQKKNDKILALQALDTLSTSTGNDAFGQRIACCFELVIEKLSEYIKTLQLSPFFDFLEKFLKVFHSNFTSDNLKLIMDALVERVVIELRKKNKKTLDLRAKSSKAVKSKASKQSLFKIAKCWGAIRYIAESPFFSGPLVPIIEDSVKPLLEFVA